MRLSGKKVWKKVVLSIKTERRAISG